MVRLTVKVVPRSGRSACTLDKSGAIKCYVKNPPEHGRANYELCALIAKAVGIAPSAVTIVRGATARTKVLALQTSLTMEQVLTALGCEVQRALF